MVLKIWLLRFLRYAWAVSEILQQSYSRSCWLSLVFLYYNFNGTPCIYMSSTVTHMCLAPPPRLILYRRRLFDLRPYLDSTVPLLDFAALLVEVDWLCEENGRRSWLSSKYKCRENPVNYNSLKQCNARKKSNGSTSFNSSDVALLAVKASYYNL